MMRLTMKERKTVTKALAKQYRKASKNDKGRILTQMVEATGYNRSYASWLLRNHGRQVEVRPGVVLEGSVRSRPRTPRPRRSALLFPPGLRPLPGANSINILTR